MDDLTEAIQDAQEEAAEAQWLSQELEDDE